MSIAYQTVGDGPLDIIYVPGWVSNLDYAWIFPPFAHVFERLSAFSRLILFDKRGTGLSDRNVGFPTLEERMRDMQAVLDAAGSRRAVLMGTSEGGNMCMLFAATYPEKTAALVLNGSFAKGLWAEDYPWAKTREQVEEELAAIARDWGGAFDLSNAARRVMSTTGRRATGLPATCAIRPRQRMQSHSGAGTPRSMFAVSSVRSMSPRSSCIVPAIGG
ncbi:alpha/beta fold hydrolase [Sinorhizobium meliloti]|uniref:alpha/beta fold hydrolase n=1 Tax=Rhizobium meliloti TaxID=382 RepID=UPI001F1AABC5|nr:alpha/beta hydrolase [Sinorhizobium meliloti]